MLNASRNTKATRLACESFYTTCVIVVTRTSKEIIDIPDQLINLRIKLRLMACRMFILNYKKVQTIVAFIDLYIFVISNSRPVLPLQVTCEATRLQ